LRNEVVVRGVERDTPTNVCSNMADYCESAKRQSYRKLRRLDGLEFRRSTFGPVPDNNCTAS
jgi:hypothetical protein